MSVANYQYLSWEDNHTIHLNNLYTLYCREIMWEDQLCNIGYQGFPDPLIRDSNRDYTPDLLAINESELDTQYVDICGTDPDCDLSMLLDQIEAVGEYHQISGDSTSSYLDLYDLDLVPSVHEPVAVVPHSTYNTYQSEVESSADEHNVTVWSVKTNGTAEFSLECGSHSNIQLQEQISDTVESYPQGNDLLQFTRSTDRNLLKFEFTQRLVNYSFREKMDTFEFQEVDKIMADMRPPMLGHLTKDEREDHWRDFLYSLLTRFNLIEQSGQNKYTWKKEKFLREPRYCRQILDGVRQDLGLGDSS